MSILALQSGIFIAAALLTGLCKALAERVQLLDRPSHRSNHSIPTPVGGGLAIALLFILAASHYYFSGLLPLNLYMAALAGGLVALTGLADDWLQLSLKWRVSAQIIAAAWALAWLGELPAVNFLLFQLHSQWLLSLLALLSMIWLLNLYNFMDGIDGLAASELMFVNAMSLLLVINNQDTVVALLSATLFSAAAGFLVWNWPPARIFMGDTGSSFIGFSLGLLALLSMQNGSLTLWTWLILLGVFVVDATTTLLRRIMHRESWYQGHSTHAYQHAARKHQSHAKVTITVLLINGLWLAPWAWLSVIWPEWGIVCCLVALSPLLIMALALGAGRPQTTASAQ